jgi:hypothetical protein
LIHSQTDIYERWFSTPDPGSWVFFSTQFLFAWFSALPVQALFNLILGEDNFVEEHLMIPSALLMWSVIGAAIGATIAKIKNLRRSQ